MVSGSFRRGLARVLRPDLIIDYAPGGAVPPDRAPGPVDVIVPVYGAAEALARCLRSLARHTDWSRHRLVIVVDGPQADDLEQVLRDGLPAVVSHTVLRNDARGGFVRSANRGMAFSDRDVVLLNSDTEVTEGWLEGLQAAAYSRAAIGTVTPFSNDATLCSVPEPFAANAMPAGHDVDSLGRLVARVSQREYPPLPTGVGLCLYIKRAVLGAVGFFDEVRFGLGYGEENDFCLRALRAGYLSVLDDATFVYHAGQGSFGPERRERVRRAERVLAEAHPGYLPTIARFMEEDPLRPARERIVAALVPRRPPRAAAPARVLHVVQGWPPWSRGGTEVYARGLAVRQAGEREVAVHARLADTRRALGDATHVLDHGVRVRLVVNNFAQRDPLSRNSLRNPVMEADFGRWLEAARPDLVHIHHLAGHSLGLVRGLAARGIPYVLQLQDWWLACARIMLLRPDRSLCTGPGLAKCARCLPLTAVPPASLWSRALYARRRGLAREVVRGAAALVAGSRFAAESVPGFLGLAANVDVLPYGVEVAAAEPASRDRGKPLRFGVLGAVMPHKGVHVAVEAFRGVDPARARLEVWGDPAGLPAYGRELRESASPAVRFEGVVPEEEKAARLSGLDVLVVPSLGLESFGIAAREALARGVPVLASRRGALVEAFVEGSGGAFFEPGDVAGLRGWVDRLCADPSLLEAWAARRPAVASMDDHAAAIEAVYARVMSARRVL